MGDRRARELSCEAKLARVVLANCGPLCPSEVADEAYLSVESARAGLAELAERNLADPVCGVREDREEVYELSESSLADDPSA